MQFVYGIVKEDQWGKRYGEIISKIKVKKGGVFNLIILVFLVILINTKIDAIIRRNSKQSNFLIIYSSYRHWILARIS